MVASIFQEDKQPEKDTQCDMQPWGAHLMLIVKVYYMCERQYCRMHTCERDMEGKNGLLMQLL